MTKKHFVLMAQYIAEMPGTTQRESDQRQAVYRFALYLAHWFGKNFNRGKFDAYIEKRQGGSQ